MAKSEKSTERTDGLGNEIVDDAMYYVQDCRQLTGNCISWWRHKGEGYACNLAEAGTFTGERVRGMRGTDVPWPTAYVHERAVTHVRGDTQAFSRHNYKPGPR